VAVALALALAGRSLSMGRVRLSALGAVLGLAWAASLRGFMQQLAGPTSTFTFSGTFGVIIPTGVAVGALLGWAEYQQRIGRPIWLLILAPLLIGIIPILATGQLDFGPIGLALVAMAGGYALSGRGPRWTRILAGAANLASLPVIFLAPKPYPDLSYTTAQGAWFDTLAVSLGVVLALACAIPMRRADPAVDGQGRPSTRSAHSLHTISMRHPQRSQDD
jgi:hypothetical protein